MSKCIAVIASKCIFRNLFVKALKFLKEKSAGHFSDGRPIVAS